MRIAPVVSVLAALVMLAGPAGVAPTPTPAPVLTPAPAPVPPSAPTPVPPSAPPSAPAPGAGASSSQRFVLPVSPPATVLTPFRPPEHRYGSGHRGVDLAAPAGSPVRAAGAGTVVYAGPLAGRGVLSIQHAGGLRTTYEPVTASVTAGQHVAAGEVVGTATAGHPSCAPADCLHWGARLPDETYLDPMALLRPWQVRLLPWNEATTS